MLKIHDFVNRFTHSFTVITVQDETATETCAASPTLPLSEHNSEDIRIREGAVSQSS